MTEQEIREWKENQLQYLQSRIETAQNFLAKSTVKSPERWKEVSEQAQYMIDKLGKMEDLRVLRGIKVRQGSENFCGLFFELNRLK